MFGDTIAAISTAWGDAGISIIRMSGPDAFDFAGSLVRTLTPPDKMKYRIMYNGSLLDESGGSIDQVLLVLFQAPKSYTGEDLAEIHCHGGSLVAQRCLERCLQKGCRHADPGEFTRRAYENGRLDLSQAEAVNGIIHARSNEALRAANRTLQGELSRFVREIYDELLGLSAELEVGIDFPEEDVPYIEDQDVSDRMETLIQDLGDLLDRCTTGYLLREGIRVALIGRPNVGKSSLLNSLLRESRAIVTSIPGTTRDVIEEVFTHRGIPLRLMDTAGLRETPSDEVEAMGIERTTKAIDESDVILWILDGSEPLEIPDRSLAGKLSGKPHIVALNKSDLPKAFDETDIAKLLPESWVIRISAQEKRGLEELKEAIVDLVSGTGTLDAGLNATARQVEEIRVAIESLADGKGALDSYSDQTLAASSIREARSALERLLGLQDDEALLDLVFSRFCVGK
ncbi:tRNA uridine-5-carboxymethylaminomethyl(34) synthesis GTPase MnmE [Dethiosulfovibrio sp. F2B]|uniref:tRNA uridine-5-carboxymethylaminomethyl(34) synthesis GTPase MnmE n=1 Tax=Dethiosulfovibrio faecalis TaxID=2720018 RepID=UPI001F2D47BB|nr:tRNA uridine-5-carboxymethylaminomethyl(34) synthesis GTPase MnmE [Dethiosulfovibrio faecalis]MCF4151642.1 tRNA uridine-5-carboxymethylaminomethyl(34) synthesis GTPase MnmE [Dethiosulfovibrio faecalis]